MGFELYDGADYWDADQVDEFCRSLAAAYPRWVQLDVVGNSLQGRPIYLLTIGDHQAAGSAADRPAFWLDGGTHASEWTGVMAAVFCASRWVEALAAGDESECAWFAAHTIYVLPCISPDGMQALYDGAPFLRSTLRPPRAGNPRSGLDPCDMDGDGAVRWMRWRHPAGPYVADKDQPLFMRPRRLGDDPAEAYFYCAEGELIEWDGVRWTAAALKHGLDLNRNFPSSWEPFSMFGMDGGDFALSEPESRAMADAVRARPNIGCALTNHTYTGALLVQPYRKASPLGPADVRLMELMAHDAVEGTGYRVIRVYPDFVYDPDKSIVGVWADSLSTVFGIPGYTLELWDPFAFAGVNNDKPAEFFLKPDPQIVAGLLRAFAVKEHAVVPWRSFDHPQLGPVEIGGLDYMRTIRNPPRPLLAKECERGFNVADRLRRALPHLQVQSEVERLAEGAVRVRFVAENLGFLSTSCLDKTAELQLAAPLVVRIETSAGLKLVGGKKEQVLGHLDGWGTSRIFSHSIYPQLPARGHRAFADYWFAGSGTVQLHYSTGRAGRGVLELQIGS